MPPLDWGRIMGADVEALREDLDAADDMYGVLEMVNFEHSHRNDSCLSEFSSLAESWCEMTVFFLQYKGSVNPDSEEAVDVNKMIKLFEVTKTIMKVWIHEFFTYLLTNKFILQLYM